MPNRIVKRESFVWIQKTRESKPRILKTCNGEAAWDFLEKLYQKTKSFYSVGLNHLRTWQDGKQDQCCAEVYYGDFSG